MPSSRSKFVVYAAEGKYHWELRVRGETVAASAKEYSSAKNARRAIESLLGHLNAPVVEEDQ